MPDIKKKSIIKKQPAINVQMQPDFNVPKFCNLASVDISHDDEEVIFDFFYMNKKIKDEKGSFPAFPIAKIAMTKAHAQKFNKILINLLTKKDKK